MNRNTPSSLKFSLLFSANSPTHPPFLPPSPQRSHLFARSLLSMRCLLLRYNLEPRLLNSRALGTVTSVMIIGLSINGCSHSKKPVWGEKTRLTSLEVRAAAWRDSGRALFSIFLWGGGNPLIWAQKHYSASDKLYRYVLPHRLGSGRVHFAHFGLESRMVFEGTTGVYESIYRFNSKKKEKEKSANSKWIWSIFWFAL